MNNIELSSMAFTSASKLIENFSAELKINKKETMKLSDRFTVAINGLMLLMSELDRERMVQLIYEHKLNKIVERSARRVAKTYKQAVWTEDTMGKVPVGILITDENKNTTVLSGIHDNPDAWEQISNYTFESKDVKGVTVEIHSDDEDYNYRYKIDYNKPKVLQIIRLDTHEELSEKTLVDCSFLRGLMSEGYQVLEDTEELKSVKLNVLDTTLIIKDVQKKLMVRPKLNIEILM